MHMSASPLQPQAQLLLKAEKQPRSHTADQLAEEQRDVSSSTIVGDYVNTIQLPAGDSFTAASRVVSLGSFSKIMAPGLRLG